MLIKTSQKNEIHKIRFIIIFIIFLSGILLSDNIKEKYNHITGFLFINNNITNLLTDGLVLYYDFNELNEGIIYDKSTHNNTGINYGIDTSGGVEESAALFNGLIDYIKIENSSINTVNQTNSLSYWINPSEQKSSYFGKGTIFEVSKYAHSHSINNDCWLIIYRWNNAIKYRYEIPNCIEQWTHVVETYDAENEISALFINGEMVKIVRGKETSGLNGIILIGKPGDETDKFFNGKLDELRIYNRVLNNQEINALFEGHESYISSKQENVLNEIKIEISPEDYEQLLNLRNHALFKGLITDEEKKEFDIKIINNNQTIKAKIRLKGDCVDHVSTNKWSFRIDISSDERIFGMKEFNLQAPERRAINEWIYYKLLKEEDLIGLRYIYVNLTINNETLGSYVIEEHLSKELLENNERIEGPIITFSEDIVWLLFNDGHDEWTESYFISGIETFELKRLIKNDFLYEQFLKAETMMELFRNRELKTSDVFEIKKLAKFTAINDIMGAVHAEQFDDRKYYYNPITCLIEPIGFDADAGQAAITELSGFSNKNIGRVFSPLFVDDLDFVKEYIKELERVSKREYIDNFLETIPKGINFNPQVIYYNQEFIKKKLDPEKGIQAYLHYYNESKNEIKLKIGNIQEIPIEIISLSYKGIKISENENQSNILLSYYKYTPVNYEEYVFKLPQGFNYNNEDEKEIKVNYRLLGTTKIKNEIIIPYPQSTNISEELMIKQPNINEFEFIYTVDNKIMIIGDYEINKTLIVPKNYNFIISPGSEIDLTNNATIISYSPIRFVGTNAQPIIIKSSDGTGQGLSVINSGGRSIIENLAFYNLGEPQQGLWHLTGAVTFYESDVTIKNCKFLSSNSEDSLNIKNSEFTISDSSFMNSKSDCLDLDFTTGTITSTEFNKCNGDSIDTSGSIITIQNVNINGTGDKGISIGEASIVQINNAVINNSFIGLASKDSSNVEANNVQIYNTDYGLVAYQKKEEYGPANITITNTNAECLTEENSHIITNNQECTNIKTGIFNLLYTENNVRRI